MDPSNFLRWTRSLLRWTRGSRFLYVQVTRGVNVKNIGQVVTERLNALRRLTLNPDDTAAMNAAYEAQQKV